MILEMEKEALQSILESKQKREDELCEQIQVLKQECDQIANGYSRVNQSLVEIEEKGEFLN